MSEKRVVAMSQPGTSRLSPTAWATVVETRPSSAADGQQDWIAGEPRLQDLLSDPLVHAVLQRDGLDLQDLRQAIARGRRRLSPALRPQTAGNAA